MNKLFTFADFSNALNEDEVVDHSAGWLTRPDLLIVRTLWEKLNEEGISIKNYPEFKKVIQKALQEVGIGQKKIPIDKVKEISKAGGGKIYLNKLLPCYDLKTKLMVKFLYSTKADSMTKLIKAKIEKINKIVGPKKKSETLSIPDGIKKAKDIISKVDFSDMKPYTTAAGLKDYEVKDLIVAATDEMYGTVAGLGIRGALNFVKF